MTREDVPSNMAPMLALAKSALTASGESELCKDVAGAVVVMHDEIVRLRERVAAAAKAWKFVEMNADLSDKGPLGEGWMSKEMGEAISVLAALGGDDA